MPYECIINELSEYLRVDVSGDWTPGKEFEDAFNVWAQVAGAFSEGKTSRILAVWDVPGRLPTFSAYELGSMADSLGVGRVFRLAIVHLHEDRFQDSLFAETVATNRGFQVKIFNSETKSLVWLLS